MGKSLKEIYTERKKSGMALETSRDEQNDQKTLKQIAKERGIATSSSERKKNVTQRQTTQSAAKVASAKTSASNSSAAVDPVTAIKQQRDSAYQKSVAAIRTKDWAAADKWNAEVERLDAEYKKAQKNVPLAQGTTYIKQAQDAAKKTSHIDIGMSEDEKKSRIQAVQTEIQRIDAQIPRMRAAYDRASGYGKTNLETKITETENRKRELDAELKRLERSGDVSRLDEINWGVEDAEGALADAKQREEATRFNGRTVESLTEYNKSGKQREHQEAVDAVRRAETELEKAARQKQQIETLNKYGAKRHEDRFGGQFGASFDLGTISVETNKAFDAYLRNPTEENRNYAYAMQELEAVFSQNNRYALDDEERVLPWITDSAAGYLPQLIDQAKTTAPLAAGGLLLDAATLGTSHGAFTKAAIVGGSGLSSYEQMRGAAYRNLLAAGLDEETARSAASDEAFLSSVIEMLDTFGDVLLLGGGKALKALGAAAFKSGSKNAAVKTVAKLFGKSGTEILAKKAAKEVGKSAFRKGLGIVGGVALSPMSESLEEGSQQAISIANMRNPGAGKWELVKGAWDVLSDSFFGQDEQSRTEILEAAKEGAKIAIMFGGSRAAVNHTVAHFANAKSERARNAAAEAIFADPDAVQALIEKGKEYGPGTTPVKIAERLETAQKSGKNISLRDTKQLLAAVSTYEKSDEMQVVQSVYDDEEMVQALVDEGHDIGGKSSKIADQIAYKVSTGEEVTRDDIRRLVEANEAVNTKAVEAETQTDETQKVDRASGFTGYGENGRKAFVDAMETRGDVAPADVALDFEVPYQRGRLGQNENTVKLDTPLKQMAYNAGRLDYMAQLQADREHQAAAIYSEKDSSVDWTYAPRDITRRQKRFVENFVRSMGARLGFAKGEQRYNAFFNPDTGEIEFDAGFGIPLNLAQKLGSQEYLDKVNRLSKNREHSFIFYVAHEIATHAAMDRAPVEMRAFVSEMYAHKQKDAKVNLAREKQDFYASRNENIDTVLAFEEVVADYILDLYNGNEKAFMAAVTRIMNGTNENARQGARTFKTILDDIIAKLKAWVQKLKGNEKATVEQEISELEHLRGLFETALSSAMETVAEARQNGKTEQKNTTTKSGVGKYSIKQTADGRWYVQADRQILFGNDSSKWGKQIEEYINEHIRKGEDVTFPTQDGHILVLTERSAYKLSDRHRGQIEKVNRELLSDEEFALKGTAAGHIDELIQVAKFDGYRPDQNGFHKNDIGEDGFNYFEAYFKDGGPNGEYYLVIFSAGLNEELETTYSIGKIRKRRFPSRLGSSGKAGALIGTKKSSNVIIRTSSEKSQQEKTSFELAHEKAEAKGAKTFSLKDSTGKTVDDAINQSMTMKQAKDMVQRAFVAGNIKEWFEGEYQNGDEWLKGEGVDSVALTIESEQSLYDKFIIKIQGILDEDFTTEDVLNAYLAGTLTGAESETSKTTRLNVSSGSIALDNRFYAPRQIENEKAVYEIALQKVTNKNRDAVTKARADVIMFAHTRGAAEVLGLTQAELNAKVRQWARYTARAKEVSQRFNSGVAEWNRWTGIENSNLLNKATVSNEDLDRLVGTITGDNDGFQRKYIMRAMLALDTHIDYTGLNFAFADNPDPRNSNVNGLYTDGDRTITVKRYAPHTVAHEMGHYLDYQWARDIGAHGGMTSHRGRDKVTDPDAKQWATNFDNFIETLDAAADVRSGYTMDSKEVFARFVDKFVRWVNFTANGEQVGSYKIDYNDKFTAQHYIEFVRLLQEKAVLDGKRMSNSALDSSQNVMQTKRALTNEKNTAGVGNGKASIDPSFDLELDRWDGKSDKTFFVGTTSRALQTVGVQERGIVWHSKKIAEILKKHPGMTIDVIRQVPQILEYPIAILKSQNSESRLAIFGEIVDNSGAPVTAILELQPTARGGRLLNMNVVASAYGKNSNPKRFVEQSDLLYLDPNRNRTKSWMQGLGLQLPSDTTAFGSIGSITYQDGIVKIVGAPYKQYMRNGATSYTSDNGQTSIDSAAKRKSVDENESTKSGDRHSLKGEAEFREEVNRIREAGTKAGKTASEIELDVRNFANPHYSELIESYGAIEQGEKPAREVQVPKKTEQGRNVSQTVRTILEAKATPDTVVPKIQEMIASGDFSYETVTDQSAMASAERTIENKGFSVALADWINDVESGKVDKANTALGWELYNQAANAGDVDTAVTILNRMVGHQRNAAQAVQATRILKKLTPDAQLYSAVKETQKLGEELKKKFPKFDGIQINEILAEEFMRAETQEERDRIMADIYRDIGSQMPASWADKFNAWRYMAMLTNLRTHVRNVGGNAGFVPLVIAKDVTAGTIEKVVNFATRESGGIGRTKGRVKRDLLKAAWDDFANVQDIVKGGGKYNDAANANRYIEEGRRIYKTKALERVRKLNSELLDREDMWFSKPHYAYALAQYCSANGITAEQLRRGKALGNARAYAIKEAQKATYRDTNAFSQAISKLGKTRNANSVEKAIGVAMEGVLPFRKTPANILVRGVEYSPLGLLKGLTVDLARVRKGEMDATEAIDNISAGLVGTELIALGAFLAAQGLIRGAGGSDEEKKEFEELQGHQDYALELPDGTSVTLDWLAPEALPFFVGVNLYETIKEGKKGAKLADLLSAVTNISDPMLELSCLQSLNDVFDSLAYANDNDTSALVAVLSSATTSYLTQYVPTLFGQAERSFQKERMTTYTEKGNWLTSDMQYTLGKTSAKIPGWDFQQIPYIDAWGRIEGTENAVGNAMDNVLNPAYTSKVKTSAMEKELTRLYDETGEAKVLPKRADKYFNVDGERKNLTADEYVKYATAKGKVSYELTSKLISSSAYHALSDEDKVEVVSMAYEYANANAKAKVDAGYSVVSWVEKANAGKTHGITVPDYILARVATQNIDSGLKDRNGDMIDNSKSLLIMQAIYKIPGLNDSKRQYLFEALGVGKKVRHYNKVLVDRKLDAMRRK